MMDRQFNFDNFDVAGACSQASDFIETKRVALKRDGVLIGLSGGLDSAVVAYLAAKSVDTRRIMLLNLPEKDSKNWHQRDAQLIADALGIPLKVQDLTPVLEAAAVYRMTPLRFIPGRRLKEVLVKFAKKQIHIDQANLLASRWSTRPHSLVARGNAYAIVKHRMRMVLLYQLAETHNLLVVGAANKTEFQTGTFSLWGCDQCADIMPIIHLYRSQIEKIAEYLHIPERIRNKPADPDIIPGVDDKGALLGSFHLADQILWAMENGASKSALDERFGEDAVNRIYHLYQASHFMREAPYFINGVRPMVETNAP